MEDAAQLWVDFAAWITTPAGVAVVGLLAVVIVAIVRATPTPEDNRILGRVVTVLALVPPLRPIATAIERALRDGKDGPDA